MSDNFKAREIGLRAQKKLLSRFSNKTMVKVFIDDTMGQLLENLYRLAKAYSGKRKESEKVVKNIVKVVVKIGVLYRNDQFSHSELDLAESFKKKFHSTVMTITSFYEVDFSYDRNFLLSAMNDCCSMMRRLVHSHLTDKSISRIDSIFQFFGDPNFMDCVFKPDYEHRELVGKIVADLHKALDKGDL